MADPSADDGLEPGWVADAGVRERLRRGASRRVYDETTFRLLSVVPVTPEEAGRLPEDGADGYIALEIRLNRLLKPRRE